MPAPRPWLPDPLPPAVAEGKAAATRASRARELAAPEALDADRRLASGPPPLAQEPPTGGEGITTPLLVDGLPDAAIATALVLSPKTVGHHVSSVLRKLEVPTRSRAAAEAHRRGLLDDRPARPDRPDRPDRTDRPARPDRPVRP